MRVGFVGTGSMGSPVARNLLSAGAELVVHDQNQEAAYSLLVAGATWAEDPARLARDVDVVFLSLPSHVEVEKVCFGPGGLFSTIRPGTYLIDLTTGSTSMIPRLVEAQQTWGIHYLACPVSQGVDGARAGTLSIFVGGDPDHYEHCRPLFDAIASEAIHTGDHRSAMAAKLATNLLWFVHAGVIGEALALGAKAGIDLMVLRQVLLHSCGTSWVVEHDLGSIYEGTFDPSFSTALCVKDLGLIDELAHQLGVPLEFGALAGQVFARAQDLYGGDAPELSVVRYVQDRTRAVLQVASDENLAEVTGV